MGGADEKWIKAALIDDAMVADLLVRLHHPPPPPRLKTAALPLDWSVRQRRSKSVSINNNAKKLAHRGSPTTPLSWSGATSFSGGSEESSRLLPLRLSDTSRSKDIIDSEKATLKRSRKKKTLTELKDEENSLLKERRQLKREMSALRVSLERQKATNDSLKKLKIELQPHFDRESTSTAEASTSGQPLQIVSSNYDATLQSSTANACVEENACGSKFVVPDLNIPFDNDIICGIR